MKKLFLYTISMLSIICMLMGFFLKKETLFAFGFYLHFVDATYVALERYKSSNNITFRTILYPAGLVILTVVILYQGMFI
ncbi:MAG: hypothetical protein ACRCXT_05320 [Paraclostridium sp.]